MASVGAEAALDMSLDDVIAAQGRGGGYKGRGGAGKGRGRKGAGKGREEGSDRIWSESAPSDNGKAASGAAAALDMSLDDVIESGKGGGRKGGRNGKGGGEEGADSNGRWSGGGGDWGSGGKWDSKWKDGGSSWGGGASKSWAAKSADSGKASWEDWGSKRGSGKDGAWGSAGSSGAGSWDSSWSKKPAKDSWDSSWESKKSGGRDDFWSAPSSKDEWGSSGRAKYDSWTSGKSREDAWGSGGARDGAWSGGGRRAENDSSDRWTSSGRTAVVDRWEAEEPRRSSTWGAQKRRHEDSAQQSPAKQIKVKNIPMDLDWRDIKGAFEAEAGKIDRCELNKGTAWITFTRPEDARKAVETFDRGELNGKTIGVAFAL